jgi:hypothetical protein
MANKPNEKPVAEILAEIGRALYGVAEWQSHLASALGVRRDSMRHWMSGRQSLSSEHGMWDDLLRLAKQRELEVRAARENLEAWLERNRTLKEGE